MFSAEDREDAKVILKEQAKEKGRFWKFIVPVLIEILIRSMEKLAEKKGWK